LVAGNWKMHKTVAESRALAEAIALAAERVGDVDVVLCPPFTSLAAVAGAVAGSSVGVGAQTMHWADEGPYTGEVSPRMVRGLAGWVLVGHSERRSLFGETDEDVNRKVSSALAHGLAPILCVGETADERDAGATDGVVARQLALGLAGLAAAEAAPLVVAYEPVWAIGTGRACAPAEAGRVAGLIRAWCRTRLGAGPAERLRVLYGGSVSPANAAELFGTADVDGGLVGGASLEAGSFLAIVAAATREDPVGHAG
jgi:triosephosphate isomerase